MEQTILTAFSAVGFPIVVTFYLWTSCQKSMDKFTDKLGEAYAMSPWTQGHLEEIIHLVDTYAKQQYEQGYRTALADARMAAMRVSFGLEQALPH